MLVLFIASGFMIYFLILRILFPTITKCSLKRLRVIPVCKIHSNDIQKCENA